MPNGETVVSRVRRLTIAGVLVAVVAAGTIFLSPEPADVESIRVAAFNIQIFGESKRNKPDVMEVLVDVAQEFDVMVVQEIRDASLETGTIYLDRINDVSEHWYALVEGPRLGRSNSKEQYGIYYIPARVEFLGARILPDPDDDFEREPIVASFRSGNFDFTVVACHIKPDSVDTELAALVASEQEIRDIIDAINPGDDDIIYLGDFNADGSYLSEDELPAIFPPPDYRIVIHDTMVTTTRTENTYDRIILRSETFASEYIDGSAQPFEFDWEYGINDHDLVIDVSDHYPVFAEFRTTVPDDD